MNNDHNAEECDRLTRQVKHWQDLAVANRKVADEALAELSALKAHPEAYQFDGQVLRDEHGNYLAEFMAYEQSFIDRLLHPQPELKAQQVECQECERLRSLLALPFPAAIENPGTSFVSKAIRRPSQIVQPYEFGDDASKATGFWLSEGVPLLVPKPFRDQAMGRMVEWPKGSGRAVLRWANQTDSGQNRLSPSDDRWLKRSETFPGIAAAMGDQWGRWLNTRIAANDNHKPAANDNLPLLAMMEPRP